MIVLDESDVRELLPMRTAVDLMRSAMEWFSAGRAIQPLRTVLHAGDAGIFGAMPAYIGAGSHPGFGLKTVVVRHDNPARGLDSHIGMVVIFSPDTGLPEAVMDASVITAVRTAAVSALATDVLARADATELAVVGTGRQALMHLEALPLVREFRRVRIWGRSRDRAREVAAWAERELGLPVTAETTLIDATKDADVICTTTAAVEPVLTAEHVAAGAHLNAVGSSFAHAQEIGSDLVGQARVFVDSRESALVEAGDLLVPMSQGRFDAQDIRAELGEVLLGARPGRTDAAEVTMYESLGLAVQDVVAGAHVLQQARDAGAGAPVKLYGK